MERKPLIIAVDGHSSCGKSTFARAIARWLGYTYIDSGAMYRAVTLYAMEHGIIRQGELDREKLVAALPQIRISFSTDPATGETVTLLNGRNVEKQIRSLEVSQRVSEVSRIPEVRQHLVQLQRQLAGSGGVVMDGRDIGTVVFPDADIKIFMTARPEVRAQRRYKELLEKGEKIPFEEVLANVKERDRIDTGRAVSPLRQADDALVLDNSEMTVEEQMEWIRRVIEKKMKEKEDADRS